MLSTCSLTLATRAGSRSTPEMPALFIYNKQRSQDHGDKVRQIKKKTILY